MTAKSDGKQQLSQQADGKLALEQNSFPVVIVGFGCARLNHHSERTVVRSLFIYLFCWLMDALARRKTWLNS